MATKQGVSIAEGTMSDDTKLARNDANVAHKDESIADLINGLVADAQTLIRKEVDLAKTEIKSEVGKAISGSVMLGIGVAVLAVGGILLTLMLVQMLIAFAGLAPWLAYLIVGVVFAIIGGILLAVGISKFRSIDPMPRKTIETVQEDAEWLKTQSQSVRK